jgi:hypothetical protein
VDDTDNTRFEIIARDVPEVEIEDFRLKIEDLR